MQVLCPKNLNHRGHFRSTVRSGTGAVFLKKTNGYIVIPCKGPKAARQQFLAFYTNKVTCALKNVSMRKQC
jgi:hypothetical protein